jgi:glutathione S-transferase
MTLLRELNARYAAASPEGPFFFGSNISVVDLAVVPILARFSIALALYRGFQPLREVRQGCVCAL